MTDAESIQLFAQLNGMALRTLAQQGSRVEMPEGRGFNYNNIPQQLPQPFPPQRTNVPDFQVPQIPDFIPTNVPIQPVEFPKDAQGNPIVPAEYRHIVNNQPPTQNTNTTPVDYSNASFNVPNYANTSLSESEVEDKFDAIIKEIKSLKKAINKLIKQNEPVKLQDNQPSTEDVNATEIKPA